MAKDPAFLFYPGDWLGGTMGMTFEEKGAYLELLVMQWNCHRITKEVAIRLVGNELWQKIAAKFYKDERGYFNKRLEEEVIKRRQHSEKQKDNANKRWHKNLSGGNATAMPLENENRNENENRIKVEDWENVKRNFFNAYQWQEKFCRDKNILLPTLKIRMEEFISDVELKEDWKDLRELKSHFTNLFNKNKHGFKPTQTGRQRGASQLIEIIKQDFAAGRKKDNGT